MKNLGLILSVVLCLIPLRVLCSESVVGVWHLEKMERQNEKGGWDPRCFRPTGILIYTDQGTMSVGINCMKSAESKEPTTEPSDMVFYTGTYSVQDQKIIHHVKNSATADFFGKDLERTFSFENQLLMLSGKGKGGKSVRLYWKREEWGKSKK